MPIATFLDQLDDRIAELDATRTRLLADLDRLLAGPSAARRDLTADEDRRFQELRGEVKRVAAELAELRSRRDELAASEARRSEAVAVSKPALSVQVRREAGVYYPGAEHSFFVDLVARRDDPSAQERLAAHQAGAEVRAITSSNVAGLVPPAYLSDLVAELPRAGRPFANAVTGMPLPGLGTEVVLSRVTTGSSAASQASEGATVTASDPDDTAYTVPVRTIAGLVVVSRQAVERGAAVDQVIFADLLAAYDTELDRQLLNGSGSSGQHAGLLSVSGIHTVTYTDSSPSVAELWPKLADAVQRVNSNRGQPADLIVMHPRRWGWFTAALDSQQRPLVTPSGEPSSNRMGGFSVGASGVVGTLLGLPVLVDANVPTNLGAGSNEDVIVVCRSSDLLLFEQQGGAPFAVRLDERYAENLQVGFQAFGFSAWAPARWPAGVATVGGTGLVAPTFT